MNPLTIEQLQALKVGDWVWVIDIKKQRGRYLKLEEFIDPLTMRHLTRLGKLRTDWSTYGTNWIAYKNKEQAETNGEIIELPCKTVYTIESGYSLLPTYYLVEKSIEYLQVCEVRDLKKYGYSTDKSEVEHRLVELKRKTNER